MKKSISVNRKSRGRPKKKGGVYPVSAVRLAPELGTAVDQWASSQSDKPTRSEAIRRLVELGLTIRTKSKQGSAARAERAKELASKAIDSLTAGSPDNGETASRKRRLIKGSEEFREARVDRPKGK